ncbi:AT-rich interactive domain-containing protein 5A isoform X2 [Suncus etruscus]|uniref:AT-rich interactive domain-containing protein 5A isoform X2 n=1 Tax=Suncus etruscus TaxID=109475 RepID=UPI00211083B2|nr:AT-rich interactive domain-containing protein 5A isoform X2 [Suncus etruscus]
MSWLVLPYVRHLKGEEDKPLPPSKPKKQYKMTKDSREDNSTVERLRKAKEEKLGSQMPPEKSKAEATTNPVQLSSLEPTKERMEQSGPISGLSLPHVSASDCPEAYKRLLSNFYSKGTHGIMSPLAKKKLLAQVSKAGALQCREENCQHGAEGPPRKLPEPSVICPPEHPVSPVEAAERDGQMLGTQEALQGPGRRPAKEAPMGPGLSSPIFTNCFHTCPTKVLKPVSQHPQDLPHLKNGVLMRPCSKEGPQFVWGGDASHPSAFHRGSSKDSKRKPKACWVSPMAKAPVESPSSLPAFPGSKRHLEEEGVAHGGKKLWAMPPFLKEVDAKECEAKTIGPDLAVSCLLGSALGPALPEAYRGTMLRWPLNFASSLDPLKGQASHPFSPLVIPAFPAQFLANTAPSTMSTGLQYLSPASFDNALHHRLYPGSPAWHVPPATAYAAPHFFHLNTKL